MLIWKETIFQESPMDDGSIEKAISIDLEGDEFAWTDDVLTDNSYKVHNLPEGLQLSMDKIGPSSLSLALHGKVTKHETIDDISNLGLTFNDNAFKTINAANIQQSEILTLQINYYDEKEGIRLFAEDFEDTLPPALPLGWEVPDGSNGSVNLWETVVGSNHTQGGYNGIQFYNKNSNNESFWLISPAIDLMDFNDLSLSFWQKYDLNGDAKNKVAISIDKQNWTVIYDDHPKESDVWEEAKAKIPEQFLGKTVYLGFCIYEEQAWGWFWDDVSLLVNDFNAIHELRAEKDVKLHYDDVLQTMRVESAHEVFSISIYDMLGREVASNTGVRHISTNHLSHNIYIVRIQLNDGTISTLKFKK